MTADISALHPRNQRYGKGLFQVVMIDTPTRNQLYFLQDRETDKGKPLRQRTMLTGTCRHRLGRSRERGTLACREARLLGKAGLLVLKGRAGKTPGPPKFVGGWPSCRSGAARRFCLCKNKNISKHNMKTQRQRTSGQVVLEYFILFAVVALLTLVTLSRFDDDVRQSVTGFFATAANKMAN